MADKKLRFDIEANSDAARRALADLRREFDATLGALKKQQGEVALFKAAQQDAAKLERQLNALAKAGGDTTALQASLTAQRSALAQQAAALQAAGVNTDALGAAQSRLRTQIEQATRTFRQQSIAVTAAADASVSAAAAAAAAEQKQIASAAQRAAALDAERQARIAYGNQVLASLRAQAAAQEQAAAAERRAQADSAAAARAAAANARVKAAAQQRAAQDAQNAARVEAAAAQQTARGQIAVNETRLLAAAQAQSFANAQKLTQATQAHTAALGGNAAAASNARAQLASYAATVLSVGVALKGFNALTTAGIQLQALNASLLFSTGSAEKAAAAYAYVRDTAQTLGLPLAVVGSNFAQLSAAAHGTQLEGAATEKIFTAVAKAARVMGLQSFQVDRAFLAITQIMSKGNVQAEELRGQLGEQLPGAFNIAARAMGVTTAELNKMLKSGEVLSTDFLPKFAAELERSVDSSVPAAVKTYAAEIERLKNTFTLFLQEVGKSGALEAISAQVVIVTQKLQEMSASGELQPAIDQLVGALSTLAEGLANLAEFVAKNSDTMLRLAEAFAIFKAAQIGLGLAKTVADFGNLTVAANASAIGIGRVSAAIKGIVGVAVITFTVDKLVELVQVIKEANAAEADLATARGKRNAEADILIIQNADYAQAVTKTADQVKSASDKEKAAYAASLKAAIDYWDAVAQRATRNLASTDAVPQAALDAFREARIYRQALTEFDRISGERLALEAKQAAAIKVIKDGETATIKLAVAAQIDAVKKAQTELQASDKNLADIAKKTAKFQQDLAKAVKPDGAKSLLDVSSDVTRIKQALAGGDAKGALDQIDQARQGLLDLAKAGNEAPLFLQTYARELGQLALQAGEQQKAAAAANVQEQERKLLTLQSLAKQIENLKIDANVDAAEKAMHDLHTRTQAFYDANPILVKVVTQKADNIALGVEKLPKKAGGGPIVGPGTGTSDSILMWGSNGEYMLRQAAVNKIGRSRLDYMNRTGRIPGFADGGLISNAVGSLPRPDGSGIAAAMSVLNLTLPGVGTFETRASHAVAAELERALRLSALKHGRRT